MKFIWVLPFILVLSGCAQTIEVANFDDCVAAGNPVMESYPRQCRHNDITFVEDISDQVFECLPEERLGDVCIDLYDPVCGTVNVQCITTPCPPVKETFSNSCYACQNDLVSDYTKGEC